MKKLCFLVAAVIAIGAIFIYFNNFRLYEEAFVYVNKFFRTYEEKESIAVGSTIESFKLPDTNGAERSLDDLKGKNGTIIVFVSAQCPVVKQYNERIAKFPDEFAGRGINVIGINSNSTESLSWVKSHAAEKYKFPVLIDKGNVLADKLGANVTPEIFYLNENNILVYHGAIDNSTSGDEITENYLRNAVEANSSGQPIAKTRAKAIGCSIKRA